MTNQMKFYKGDSKTYEVTVTDSAGDAFDLTGWEIVFSVKQNASDTTFTFQRKNIAAGGDATEVEDSDPTNGKFKIHIIPSNTSSLDATKFYEYDVQITKLGVVYTIIKNQIKLLVGIT